MATRRGRRATWGGVNHGGKVLVDTAPIIYFLEDHPRFASRFTGLFEAEAAGELQIAISAITLAEVLVGPLKHGQDALALRYEKALLTYETVPITAQIAVSGARLRAHYGLKLPDALQLACALQSEVDALVTYDRDFSGVQGFTILMGDSATST